MTKDEVIKAMEQFLDRWKVWAQNDPETEPFYDSYFLPDITFYSSGVDPDIKNSDSLRQFDRILEFFQGDTPGWAEQLRSKADAVKQHQKSASRAIGLARERSKCFDVKSLPDVRTLRQYVGAFAGTFEHIKQMLGEKKLSAGTGRKVETFTDKPEAKPQKKATPTDSISPESRVLAVYAAHPGWTITDIAKKANVNRTSLYRMKIFRKAWEVQKKEGQKNIPRGSKDEKTGVLEAWENQ